MDGRCVSLMGFLNVTVFMVFLLLLPLRDREGLQCGLGTRVVRGSFKLTIFVFTVFLKPLGVGREVASRHLCVPEPKG